MRVNPKKLDSFKIVELIVLVVLAIAFQMLTSFSIPSLAICLIPLTIAAIMLGLEGGILLGIIYGVMSVVGGFIGNQALESQFFEQSWILASLLLFIKGVGTGVLTAITHKGLKRINRYAAVIFASVVAPVANTALLFITSLIFIPSLEALAIERDMTIGNYIATSILFERFLPEIIINLLATILIVKVVMILRKKYKISKHRINRSLKYSVAFFDLDGTVADSGEGVTNSVIYALEKFDINEKAENTKRFVGPPLAQSFKEFYGFDEEKTELAIKHYREYYKEKGIYQCHLYDGIKELLSSLKNHGYKVVLCTSKPEGYARKVLEYLEVDKYFDFVCGATMDEKTRATKEAVMSYALMVSRATPSTTIMIGDRSFDICSANYFGLDSIGVTFGYGTSKELKDAKATYVVSSCEEIKKILL